MTDLNVTLFYKARFRVDARTENSDLLWDLILKIRTWMCRKWERNGEIIPWDTKQWTAWKKGCTFRSENGIVTLISAFHQEENGRTNWACKLVETPGGENGLAPREWVTEIGFRQPQDQAAELSMVVFYRDRPGFIGLCAPLPDAASPGPRLIRMLLGDPKLECTVGKARVSLQPAEVAPETWPDFRALVLDPEREVPVVYLSPRRQAPEGEDTELSLDPAVLAGVLGPNALVYYGTSLEVSRQMSADEYEDILGCYNGGVRVYAPLPRTDNPGEKWRHRFLPGAFVREQGPQVLYELLRRALAQDISGYEAGFRVEDCRALIRRAQLEHDVARHKERLEEDLLTGAVEKEEQLSRELEKVDEERLQWEIEKEALQTNLDETKEALHQARQRADNFQDAAARTTQLEKSMEEVRQIADYPESPEQIAEFFLSHFRERLDFTKRGFATLKDCETAPEILWTALYDMVTILYDLYHTEDHLEVDREFNRRSRFSMSPNAGMMTRDDKKLMKEYVDEYDGRTINTEPHVKSSTGKESDKNFLRIYYCYDPETEKLVVSSCGKHRKNYSTRKIH